MSTGSELPNSLEAAPMPEFRRPLDVMANARDLGRQNLPRSAERAPSGMQKLILEHFAAEARECHRRAVSTISERERQCSASGAVPPPESFGPIWNDADLAIQRIKLESRDNLVRRRRAERRSLRELNWFKRHNGLTREADYPESRLLQLGIISAVIVSESVANTYFFAQGSDLGLLGGLLQAFLVSILNVGLAIVVGILCLRNLHHVSGLRRGLAGVFLGLAVGLTVFFNLAVGHYRDLLPADPAGALERVLPKTRADPFDLSPYSLILFAVGLAAAGLGLYKGRTLDDRYPGFGRVDRRYRSAENEYSSLLDATRPKVLDAIEAAQHACAGTLGKARAKVADVERSIEEILEIARRYPNERAAIQSECHRLLRAFREENQLVRTSEPPCYFDDYPAFEEELLPPDREALEARLEELKGRCDSLEVAQANSREQILKRVELESQQFDLYINQIAEEVRAELLDEG
jgi:hypothetical protein